MTKKQKYNLILAVETSGRKGSASLGRDDTVISEKSLSGMLKHSAKLFLAVKDLMEEAQEKPRNIRQVYITTGPGSFTGLRISATMAKIMHLACGTGVATVSTMDVIAANADEFMADTSTEIAQIAVILDAKRGQFYTAVFTRQGQKWFKTDTEKILTPKEFLEKPSIKNGTTWLLGEGLVYYKELFEDAGIKIMPEKYWYPKASVLYRLGREKASKEEFADPLTLVPAYLRGADAVPKTK